MKALLCTSSMYWWYSILTLTLISSIKGDPSPYTKHIQQWAVTWSDGLGNPRPHWVWDHNVLHPQIEQDFTNNGFWVMPAVAPCFPTPTIMLQGRITLYPWRWAGLKERKPQRDADKVLSPNVSLVWCSRVPGHRPQNICLHDHYLR